MTTVAENVHCVVVDSWNIPLHHCLTAMIINSSEEENTEKVGHLNFIILIFAAIKFRVSI